ncbi:MAG: FAD-dependent monooxygenase [Saprospiraceae bacterium]|nr:FAD-dependent monooxygenase [Saprospiraceae bacterium]
MINKHNKIIIAGSGLVGSLLGLRLLQRGFDVELFESRSDMRKTDISAGRSINLALSHRGIRALKLAGIDQEILSQAIQMKGRMIHDLKGNLQFQDYSLRPGEHINSISRRNLNVILMDAIEKIKPHAIHFNTRLVRTEKDCSVYFFEDQDKVEKSIYNATLIGTDGAASIARKMMFERTPQLRFNYSQSFQNYGYKELTIPPGIHKSFAIEKNALHIWPRGNFMMIGLPNPDATYTATIFLPYHGKDSFELLQTKENVFQFFETYFSDAVPIMPDLLEEFFAHATGHLYTVKCAPWNFEDKILLMGDAAHAIIPFYGQGMNCGFEDVYEFDTLLDSYSDWGNLFHHFSNIRKPNGDAIADLADDNFIEMRDKVADPVFQRKRKLEMQLEKQFPAYFSKYALVTFRPDISYYDAMIRGRKQDAILMKICQNEKMEWSELEIETIFNSMNSEIGVLNSET